MICFSLEEAKQAAKTQAYDSYSIFKRGGSYKLLKGLIDDFAGRELVFQEKGNTLKQNQEIEQSKVLPEPTKEVADKKLLSLFSIHSGYDHYEHRLNLLGRAISEHEAAGIDYPIIWRFELIQLRALVEMLRNLDTPIPSVPHFVPEPVLPTEPAAAVQVEPEIIEAPAEEDFTDLPSASPPISEEPEPDATEEPAHHSAHTSTPLCVTPNPSVLTGKEPLPLIKTDAEEEEDIDEEELELTEEEEWILPAPQHLDEEEPTAQELEEPSYHKHPKQIKVGKPREEATIKANAASGSQPYIAKPSTIQRRAKDDHPLLAKLPPEIRAKTHIVPKIPREEMQKAIDRAKFLSKK